MRRRASRRATLTTAGVLVGFIAIAVVAAILISFFASRDKLPRDTYVGDTNVGGLTVTEAVSRTRLALQAPIILRYQGKTVAMQPASIEYGLNEAAGRLLLENIIRQQQGLDKLPDHLREQSKPNRIPAPYQYSESKLQEYLLGIAGQFDRPPMPPQVDTPTLTLRPGTDGLSLNIQEARDLLLTSLAAGDQRTVDLPMDVIPAGGSGIQALGALIEARLAQFNQNGNIAGVFVKNLKSGEEYDLNGDVAFTAPGWLRLPLALDAHRSAQGEFPEATGNMLASALIDGDAGAANDILGILGSGDASAGAMHINELLKKVGLVNTFLAQPYNQPTLPPVVVTPANARADISATPEQNAQSTPVDTGLLLEMLNQCASDTGPLRLAFGDALPAGKCQQVMDLLAQRNLDALIASGSPGSTVIGRQSWDDNNHGEAALIRSPGADYILAIMLHGAAKLDWSATSVLIGDLARAVHAYFNDGQLPPSVAPIAAPPPP